MACVCRFSQHARFLEQIMLRASFEVTDPVTGEKTRQLCGIEPYVDEDGIERYNLLGTTPAPSV